MGIEPSTDASDKRIQASSYQEVRLATVHEVAGVCATAQWGQSAVSVWSIDEEISATRIRAAIESVVESHELLRARFARDAGKWRASIRTNVEIPLTSVDGDLEELQARARADLFAPWSIDRDSLLRLYHNGQFLVLGMHHLISDMVSTLIVARDISAALVALEKGENPEPPPVPTHFSQWATLEKKQLAEIGEELARSETATELIAGLTESLSCKNDDDLGPLVQLTRMHTLAPGMVGAPSRELAERIRTVLFDNGLGTIALLRQGHSSDVLDLSRTVGPLAYALYHPLNPQAWLRMERLLRGFPAHKHRYIMQVAFARAARPKAPLRNLAVLNIRNLDSLRVTGPIAPAGINTVLIREDGVHDNLRPEDLPNLAVFLSIDRFRGKIRLSLQSRRSSSEATRLLSDLAAAL